MGDEVQFLDPGDAAAGSADVLDAGPRRRPQRRTVLIVAALAAALVVALLVTRHGGGSPVSTPSSSTCRRTSPPPDLATIAVDPFGQANDSLTYRGGRLYGVSDMRLGVTEGGRRRTRRVSPVMSARGGSYRLVYDARAQAVWVVPLLGDEPGRIREYNRFLQLRRSVRLPQVAYDAAALNGTLYLTTAHGLLRVGPGASSAHRVRLPRSPQLRFAPLASVSADPSRHRLLLIDCSDRARPGLMSWSPRSGLSRSVRLDGLEPTLAVVRGRIWVVGSRFGTRHAALERLDPATLRPMATSALGAGIGPVAFIVQSGGRSFLVRSTSSPSALWCLDADRGRVLQQWAAWSGHVSDGGRRLWLATSLGLTSLPMYGCPG